MYKASHISFIRMYLATRKHYFLMTDGLIPDLQNAFTAKAQRPQRNRKEIAGFNFDRE